MKILFLYIGLFWYFKSLGKREKRKKKKEEGGSIVYICDLAQWPFLCILLWQNPFLYFLRSGQMVWENCQLISNIEWLKNAHHFSINECTETCPRIANLKIRSISISILPLDRDNSCKSYMLARGFSSLLRWQWIHMHDPYNLLFTFSDYY